jgi:RAB protein geranylgeranyltransferase component A
LLSTLVSSKTYRQLEFLAVGSWWIYDDSTTSQSDSPVPLKKIPAGREDVFADSSIDIKSKRALIKFVRLVVDPEAQAQAVEEHGEMSFGDYLTSRYGIPPHLQAALNALALSPHSPSQTKTSFALPRVNRHLTSFNVFGAGFNAVIPKWGGTAEVAQVACRAGAVGGSVYMLGKGIADVQEAVHGDDLRHLVSIADEDTLSTQYIVGRATDLPMLQDSPKEDTLVTRSVSIISSHLDKLFSSTHEGPAPACSVVVFPHISEDQSPVYVVVHTSETGECPKGQCELSDLFSLFCRSQKMIKHYEYLSTLPENHER